MFHPPELTDDDNTSDKKELKENQGKNLKYQSLRNILARTASFELEMIVCQEVNE